MRGSYCKPNSMEPGKVCLLLFGFFPIKSSFSGVDKIQGFRKEQHGVDGLVGEVKCFGPKEYSAEAAELRSQQGFQTWCENTINVILQDLLDCGEEINPD
eukprot:EG_transcript_53092